MKAVPLRRPAVLAGLTALLLSLPVAALAQSVSSSPTPTRAALARAWQQIHRVRGLPEPAWLAGGTARQAAVAQPAGGTARKAAVAQLTGGYQGVLEGVSTVPSSSTAWAVGLECASGCGTSAEVDDTLILHYNGTTWAQVTSPNPGAGFRELTAVKALSGSSAWAVGDYCASGCGGSSEVDKTLILHWNGTAWKQVFSRNPGSSLNVLLSVTSASSGDVWASGLTCSSTCGKLLTLTEHWNGTSWTTVSSPSPNSSFNALTGISSFPTHKAWTVGSRGSKTLALRWTGTKWVSVTTPNPSSAYDALAGVSATSATNAWAAGTYAGSSALRTLALHWNGSTWAKVSTPNPTSGDDVLQGVAARTASDAWAIGEACTSACGQQTEVDNPLILHWNGSKWSTKSAPGGGAGFVSLYSVAASSGSNAWAVGVACSSGCGTSAEVDSTLLEHWNGTAWSVS